KFRDPPRAVQLAEEVVQHAPKFADKWTTLGAASYRAGAWQKAIAALEKSEAHGVGRFTAVNGFLLAMAQWQVKDRDKAREWHRKAGQAITDATKQAQPEVLRLQREASQLLGVADRETPAEGKNK